MNFNFYVASRNLVRAVMMLAVVWSGAVHADAKKSCGEDLDCLRQRHATHPVKDVNYMRRFQVLPIERRVLFAPAKLLDYLNLDNQLQGFPNHPRAAKLDKRLQQDITDVIKDLPTAVRNLIDKKLMGIFLVQDLGGTGYSDYVYDEKHEPVGAFVVLDAEVLTRSANAWATWKENTPFITDPEIYLQATIENAGEDNRKQALQYILLHELGHVASVGSNVHQPWDTWDCVKNPPEHYPFFQLSWQLKDSQGCEVISKFDRAELTYRPDVIYYFGARLPAAVSPQVYVQLEQTNFPSLYAATSPADDFAESFVTYVHNVLMGKPFEIRIDKQGQRQTTYQGCWGTARCAVKEKMIADLFLTQQ